MEVLMRLLALIFKIIGYVSMPFLILSNRIIFKQIKIPSIQNRLLEVPAVDLATKIRNKEVTSEEVVCAYINRIREVNSILNAVVQDRFHDAVLEARKADSMVASMTQLQLLKEYPILGVPFTVKESCALKGMSHSVGSLLRKGILAPKDGETVANLRSAGGIPLLVSNTPEYCTSWETNNCITGRTLNPYDGRRSPGGSSGGEGALIGSGASVFGVGSDIAGSIRIPAQFNGIFGHKPTGGLMSIDGHFPRSSDKNFEKFLVIGPMCRYAKDLPTLVQIMAGNNASKLRLDQPLYTKDIKIFYMEDAGFSLIDVPVQNEIKVAMWKAVQHFKSNGLQTKEAPFKSLQETSEIGLSTFFDMKDIPIILQHNDDPKKFDNVFLELAKAMVGQSKYSFAGVFFCLVMYTHGFIPENNCPQYIKKGEELKREFLELLGEDGVFFYPTYPVSAVRHNDSFTKVPGVVYSMIFNVFGLPSTHVPLGRDNNGLPIGIQVVAAPYQDRLCMCIAAELEVAFGGWTPPY